MFMLLFNHTADLLLFSGNKIFSRQMQGRGSVHQTYPICELGINFAWVLLASVLNWIILQRRAIQRQLYIYLVDNRFIIKMAWVKNCMPSVRIPLCNNGGIAYHITSYTQSICFGSRGTTTSSHCIVYVIAIAKHTYLLLTFFHT